MTTLGRAPSRARVTSATKRPHPAIARVLALGDRIDRRIVARVALSAMVIQLAFGVHYGLEGAREEHQAYVTTAALTRNIDHESNLAIYRLYFVESPGWIREQAEVLRKHHLSLFG